MTKSLFTKVGLFIALLNIAVGLVSIKLKFFTYLTCWSLVLEAVSLYLVSFGLEKLELTRKILITSWTVGWVVTIMFWLYIFPIVDSKSLPPAWNYVCNHGLIHLFVVTHLYKNKIEIEKKDFKWPLLLILLYMFGMALPLKYFGITIYPKFFVNLAPTLIILAGAFALALSSFSVGWFVLNKDQEHKL